MSWISELFLAGKGVGIQPIQQLFSIGTDHAGLWQMDVHVDEAGSNQRVRVFGNIDIGTELSQQVRGMPKGDNFAIFDHQQTVFEILIGRLDHHHLGRIGDAVQDGSTVGFGDGVATVFCRYRCHRNLIELGCGVKPAIGAQQVRHGCCVGRSWRCR